MPTDAHKKAGNYAKTHVFFKGLDISIENPKGSTRSGKDHTGKAWSVRMPCDYGYVKRTLGRDGDNVDVFIGPNKDSEFVVAINQMAKAGYFDEHKFMLGFNNFNEAKAAYRAAHNIPMRAEFVPTTLQRFKSWLEVKNTQNKFTLSARLTLTQFGMKKPSQDENKPRERSRLSKIMSVAAPIAVVGGFYAKNIADGRKIRTPAVNPAALSPKQAAYNATVPAGYKKHEPMIRFVEPKKGGRAVRWMTPEQFRGEAPTPKSLFFPKNVKPTDMAEYHKASKANLKVVPDLPKKAAPAAPAAPAAQASPTPAPAPTTPSLVERVRARRAAEAATSLKDTASKASHASPPAPARVDVTPTKRNLKMEGAAVKPKKKSPSQSRREAQQTMSASLRHVVEFNDQESTVGNLMGASDRVTSAFRKGRRLVPWIRRGKQTAEDVGDMASGKKVSDPFYKKGWFKYAAAGAAVAAPFYGVRKINALANQDHQFPNSIRALNPKTGALQEGLLKAGRKIDAWAIKKKFTKERILTHPSGPLFSARVREIMFDLSADERGWDLRDARGRSARVYAPGSRRRERREKSWDEKTDNIRATRNVAAVGALAASGTAVWQAHKARRADVEKQGMQAAVEIEKKRARSQMRDQILAGVSRVQQRAPFTAKGVMPTLRTKAMSAILRQTQFNSLHKVYDAVGNNVSVGRPEIPGEDVAAALMKNKKSRSWILRTLGAGTVATGGLLAGQIAKRPLTGALVGGALAGGILAH